MKRLLTILLFAVSIVSTAQNILPRGGQANTPQDARLSALLNLVIPRYSDTVQANIPYIVGAGGNLGLDSCGAVIFTYNDNAFWYRACNPKRWISYTYQTFLPDGVYSGGQVTYSGVGLGFFVSPAVYVLGGIIYNTPQQLVVLDPADPALDRIDDIVLTPLPTGADKITGQPGTNQQPSVNPQTQLFRAFVRVPAGSLVPTGVTQFMIYDQDLGLPDEWTPSTNGGTVNFAAVNFPYHLTIYADVTAFTTANSIDFTYSDTVHTSNKGTLVSFVRLASIMPQAVNLNYVLTLAGNPVSQLVNFTSGGMSRNITAQYQGVFIPFPAFGAGDIVFDGIRIVATGVGVVPEFGMDYIQMQVGLTSPQQFYRFGVEDNNGTQNRFFNQNGFSFNYVHGNIGLKTNVVPVTHTLTIGDDPNGAQEMLYIYAPDGQNAIIQANGSITALTLNAQGAMILRPNQGGGSGHILIDDVPTQYITQSWYSGGQTSVGDIGIGILEAGVSNEFFIKAHKQGLPNYLTLYDSIKLMGIRNVAVPDSFVTIAGNVVTRTAYSNLSALLPPNIGAGFRVFAPQTPGFKTLFSNVTGAWDSTSNSNGLTYKVDTTVVATRAYASNLVTTYFNSNVGSSFRWAIPNTNQIKTLRVLNGILADSSTSNTISIQVDSSQYATKAFVNSVAGGGGFTGVTSVSVVTANGLAGTVANPTTTPAITLTTSITGVLKGNGTAISAATSGTDYSLGTSALATGLLKSTTGTGALSIAVANTDYITPAVTTLPSLTTASALVTVGNITSGGMGTGAVLRGVTMTLGADASFDMYYRSAGGVLTRLANGISGQFLGANTGAAPTWQAVAATITINSSAITSGTAGRILFQNAANQVSQNANLFWDNTNSRLGIGTATPSSLLQIAAGTATVAPFKLTAGTNLTTAAAGAFEYDGTNFYLDPAAVRKRIVLSNNVTPANGQIPIGNGVDYTVSAISPSNNTMVITNGAGSITVGLNMTPQTLTDGATITWNAANGFNATVTLGGVGRTLARTNWVAGATYTLRIVQDGTGNRTITTWPAGIRWPGGTAPTLATAAGAINVVAFYFDGTIVFGAFQSGAYL